MADTFRAIHRYAPMSARKARDVATAVRGQGVNQALELLAYTHRRAAPLLTKVIRSAIANAAQEGGAEARDLYIAAARINEGPLKQKRMRWRPGPMGRAMPIHKRTCHIEVTLGVWDGAASARSSKTVEGPAKHEAGDAASGDATVPEESED